MAHHQHHGPKFDLEQSTSMVHSRSSASTAMPVISEDEHVAEGDEPPDMAHMQEQIPLFAKTPCRPAQAARRQSLLTKQFHTDSDSLDHEDHLPLRSTLHQFPSRSSTCSTQSAHSAGTWNSDEVVHSPSTMASTPTSPRMHAALLDRRTSPSKLESRLSFATSRKASVTSDNVDDMPAEAKVEETLGRRRMVGFLCPGQPTEKVKPKQAEPIPELVLEEPVKRKCAIKWGICSTAAPKAASQEQQHRVVRHPSPAPPAMVSAPLDRSSPRLHRGSDSTVKLDSPRSSFQDLPSVSEHTATSKEFHGEAYKNSVFDCSEKEDDDWIHAKPGCYQSIVLADEIAKREAMIRRITEECQKEEEEEEAEEDDDDEDSGDDEDLNPFSDYEVEDDGFESDIEAGFASSDDESDDDSDYEWWAPKRSAAVSSYIAPKSFHRPTTLRLHADTSEDGESSDNHRRTRKKSKKTLTKPVDIHRTRSPELPDSTDFVCGTLDEDRPLEEAFLASRRQKRAAKQGVVPQDIDPTFPTSDPELVNDDLDEEDEISEDEAPKQRSKDRGHRRQHRDVFMHAFEDEEETRGRKQSNGLPKPSKSPAPPHRHAKSPVPAAMKQRLRSPAPTGSKQRLRSPPPRGAVHHHHSPKRIRSPPPPVRLTTPPPSRRTSQVQSPTNYFDFGHRFIGQTNHEPTHTSSLPRSPAPFGRGRRASELASDEEDGEETEHEKPYTRGAIDILQGLERKRLKRREKLYKQHCKHKAEKAGKRPQPGRGAERMRQIGMDCAVHTGAKILSV
jgi:hypothetical protein